jgi:hypothetical protein
MKLYIILGVLYFLQTSCTKKDTESSMIVKHHHVIGYEYLTSEELTKVRHDPAYLDTLRSDSCALIDLNKVYIPVIITRPWKE